MSFYLNFEELLNKEQKQIESSHLFALCQQNLEYPSLSICV